MVETYEKTRPASPEHVAPSVDLSVFFFFQGEAGIRDLTVTGVQTCALPICAGRSGRSASVRGRVEPRCGWSPGSEPRPWRSAWRQGRRRRRRPPLQRPGSRDCASSRPSSRFLAAALGAPEDGDHFLSLARDAQQLPAPPAPAGAPADELLPFQGGGPEDAQVGDRLPA